MNLSILFIAISFGLIRAEVFTSMEDMEAMMGVEKEVTTLIDDYIAAEKDRLERLRR